MNRTLLTASILISALTLHFGSDAQAFQKGDSNLDIGVGFAGYQTTVSFTFLVNGDEILISEEDGAGSFYLPVSYEYGIGEKIGIGAEIAYSNYFIDEEDSTTVTETVKGVDFSFLINYHLLDSDKHDLMLGLTLGGSAVNWEFEDGNEMSGSGSKVSIYAKDRIMFSEHVGLLLQLGYISYNYDSIESSTDNAVLEGLDWELSGWNFGTGLAVKF